MQELDFENSKKLHPFNQVIDIFGDNSLFAINTNGHTKGHVTYIINSVKGIYIVTGDQVNTYDNVHSGVGPGKYSSDIPLAQEHYNNIMEFLHMFPEANLLLGHDI